MDLTNIFIAKNKTTSLFCVGIGFNYSRFNQKKLKQVSLNSCFLFSE
jgi:hypothetical protein